MLTKCLYFFKVILGKWLLLFLYKTNRWNVKGREQIIELLNSGHSVIIASWHGYLLTTFIDLAGLHYYAVAGMHNDAEFITQVGKRLGWRLLRGSSSDRGKEVFIEIVRILRAPGNVIAITPDGPKGPSKIPKPGVVRAAQKTGAVIVPVVGQATRRWGFKNWDTFFVAKPFGRIEMVYGDPIHLSKDVGFEISLELVKTELDSLTELVEKRVSE